MIDTKLFGSALSLLSAILLLSGIFLMSSCDTGMDLKKYTDEFILKEDFEIDIVAVEPMLLSPVTMDFDLKGRIWVVEMTGYMRDVIGSDEDLPDGRVSFLEDTDGDGHMDKKTIFIDSLVLPRAVKWYNGGILYAEPPNLWWVEVTDDDLPGEKILVDSMYTNGGNVEHMPNGLLYNMDNWIYNAKSDRRYRYKNGEWEISPTIYRGQWGITNDITGRLFYNSNSHPIFGDHALPNSFDQNPFALKKYVYNDNIAVTRKFYPYQPTSVNRGYQEGTLMPDGKVSDFTSACSPYIYKGDAFGVEYLGNAFVCGPEANLIKRYKMGIKEGKVTATMTDTISEFIVSKEETFRPVNIIDGPDGNMYVVDMRKGLIQHRAYLTTYLINLVKEKGLDQYKDGGRIYKVSKKDTHRLIKDYSDLGEDQWVKLLGSPVYWERIKAQEYLVLKGNASTASSIKKQINVNTSSYFLIHALHTLNGLGSLGKQDMIVTIDKTTDPHIMINTLVLLGRFIDGVDNEEMANILVKAKSLEHSGVDLVLANLAGQAEMESMNNHWKQVSQEMANNELFSEALISGTVNDERDYKSMITDKKSIVYEMIEESIKNRSNNESQLPALNMDDVTDPRTKGLFLYHQNCASCHGRDGKGIDQVAPPLYESPYLNGPAEHLGLIALQGMKGPLTMDGINYTFAATMPGVKNNPELSDEDISNLLRWMRNSFSSSDESFSTEMIESLREQVKDRTEPFTQVELDNWTIDK